MAARFVKPNKANSLGLPVREWLGDLDRVSRKALGEDIKTLQLGWTIGMPFSRELSDRLRELQFIDQLPVTASGKVQKFILRDQFVK